jgi:hypothetical protein
MMTMPLLVNLSWLLDNVKCFALIPAAPLARGRLVSALRW